MCARVGLLDDAGDDVADAVLVLLEHHLALGLADALQDDLLGGLRGDAAEVVGRRDVGGRRSGSSGNCAQSITGSGSTGSSGSGSPSAGGSGLRVGHAGMALELLGGSASA